MSSDTGSIPALRQPFFAMEFIRGLPLTTTRMQSISARDSGWS